MGIAENRFIYRLKSYFNDDTVINDATTKRILMFLEDYRNETPQTKIYIDKEVIVKITEMIPGDEDIENIADEICAMYKIKKEDLRRISDKSRRPLLVKARVDFCRLVKLKYRVDQEVLRKYLNVDHTTIVHYLRYYKDKTA